MNIDLDAREYPVLFIRSPIWRGGTKTSGYWHGKYSC